MTKTNLKDYLVQLNHTALKAGDCKLCICSFGEELPATQKLFMAGDVEGMMAEIQRLSQEQGRNVYMPLAIFSPTATTRKKADQIGILGFVMDFDDANACDYRDRLPIQPDLVLETSEGRFQAFFMLDQPLMDIDTASALARALTEHSGADGCSSDVTHVWRLPNTVNYPNAKKVAEGRDAVGEPVKIKEFWDGTTTSCENLIETLGVFKGTATIKRKEIMTSDPSDVQSRANDILHQLPAFLIEKMSLAVPEGNRSEHSYNVLCLLHENGVSLEDAYALSINSQEGFMAKHKGNSVAILNEVERVYAKQSAADSALMALPVSSFGVFKPISELMKLPIPEYLIEGFIPKGGVVGLTGAAGLGKSLLALDIMLSIATGTPWAGKMTKQGKVLYLCMEGLWGLRARLEAWQKHHGIRVGLDHFFYGQGNFLLDTPEGINSFREALTEARAKFGDFDLVVVDTVSRTISDDDNNSGVMLKYTGSITSIVRDFESSVMVVHHPSKAGEEKSRVNAFRGHSSLFGSLDVGFSLKPLAGEDVVLTCEKMKDDGEPDSLVFAKVIVDLEAELGTRADGRPQTSVVLDNVGTLSSSAGATKSKAKKDCKYDDMQELVLAMLKAVPTVNNQNIKDRYFEGKDEISNENRNTIVTRQVDKLIQQGKVMRIGRGVYALPPTVAATYTMHPVFYPHYH